MGYRVIGEPGTITSLRRQHLSRGLKDEELWRKSGNKLIYKLMCQIPTISWILQEDTWHQGQRWRTVCCLQSCWYQRVNILRPSPSHNSHREIQRKQDGPCISSGLHCGTDSELRGIKSFRIDSNHAWPYYFYLLNVHYTNTPEKIFGNKAQSVSGSWGV